MFIAFRKRETERQTDISCLLYVPPNQGLNLQLFAVWYDAPTN